MGIELDDPHVEQQVCHDCDQKNGPLSKAEIVELIRPHMPSSSTDRQCANKADNLMRKMKLEYGAESIVLNGKRVWSLT